MSQSRQLAAIMFTDKVGYTALMNQDEQLAFAFLNKNRKLEKPMLESCKGKWIKEMGAVALDGFTTVTNAFLESYRIL